MHIKYPWFAANLLLARLFNSSRVNYISSKSEQNEIYIYVNQMIKPTLICLNNAKLPKSYRYILVQNNDSRKRRYVSSLFYKFILFNSTWVYYPQIIFILTDVYDYVASVSMASHDVQKLRYYISDEEVVDLPGCHGTFSTLKVFLGVFGLLSSLLFTVLEVA